MKRLIQEYDSGEIRLEDVPRPEVKPKGVLVRNHASVVSLGTERQVLEFARSNILQKARDRPDLVKRVWNKVRTDGVLSAVRAARQRLEEWMSPGYSSAGVVEAVGEEVTRYKEGDLVACAGQGYASHSEFVWVPLNFTAPVPESVSPSQAAFTTLGAIALHGIHRADLTSGDRVAVIGLGTIGQLTARILEAYGHPVYGTDVSPEAVRKATEHGLDLGAVRGEDDVERLAETFTDGVGVDATIITASAPSNDPLDQASVITRPRGTVCVVGDVGMEVDRRVFYDKELNLTVSKSYGEGRHDPLYVTKGEDRPVDVSRWTVARNMQEFLRLLDEDLVSVDDLVNRKAPLEKASGMYDRILDGEVEAGTVLLEYDTSEADDSREITLGSPKRQPTGDEVRLGLVGAGSFAQGKILPNLENLDASLDVVASAGGMSAKQAAKKFDLPRATTDYRSILEDDRIDGVVIATRHDLHARFAADALRSGKHVFVEKPLALTIEGLRTVKSAYQASDKSLFVDFNRRYSPMVETLQDHLSGRSSPLQVSIRVNAGSLPDDHWLRDPDQGGGRIRGEACHFVDLIQHLVGEDPERIYASGAQGSNLGSQDHLSLNLEFEDGSHGSLIYNGHGPERMPKEQVQVVGGNRGGAIENFRKLTLWRGTKKDTSRAFRQNKGHQAALEAFLEEIQEPERNVDRFRSVLLSSLTTLLVERSLREGGPVEVDPGEIQSK